MFDLKNIDFIKSEADRQIRNAKNYSFVGLKKSDNPASERLEFWLPLGFDTFNPTFENSKTFFFNMYRTFQVYGERKLNQLTEEERTTDRDGVFEFENGFSFVNENSEQVVFYGKLNALDKILEGYDELRISSLEKKKVRSTEIDYSKIHRYMHHAIYLDDDVIYLDEMSIAKNVLIQDSPPVIQLFCFIYTEIKKELAELDSVPDKAYELSDIFKDNYLQPDSSLFTEETFSDTIKVLKNIFEEIDAKTIYKDEDFWHFYEAIEAFLIGERKNDNDGIYFGINNFYDVWEDICQKYVLSNPKYLPRVLFADVKGRLLTRRDLDLKPFLDLNPFKMEINQGFAPRFLKPDLVLGKLRYETKENIFQIKKTRQGLLISFIDFQTVQNVHKPILDFYNSYGETIPNPIKEGKNMKVFTERDVELFTNDINSYLNDLKRVLDLDLSSCAIIDYKYMRESDYQQYNPNAFTINEIGEKENKIKDDIHKQLIYEWTVQQNFENSETQSEFWIPTFSDELDFETSRHEVITNDVFSQTQIKVIKINFTVLQKCYVKTYSAS